MGNPNIRPGNLFLRPNTGLVIAFDALLGRIKMRESALPLPIAVFAGRQVFRLQRGFSFVVSRI